MWLSNSKKYAMDGFLEERASGGSVHQVVGNGILALHPPPKFGAFSFWDLTPPTLIGTI
jgi:hypothetical protein